MPQAAPPKVLHLLQAVVSSVSSQFQPMELKYNQCYDLRDLSYYLPVQGNMSSYSISTPVAPRWADIVTTFFM